MRTLGGLLVGANLIGAAALYVGREGGDAATRGLGRGIGGLLAVLAIVAAVLLWWCRRASGPHIIAALGALDDILRRMHAHQDKKRSMLRELRLAHTLAPSSAPAT